MTHSPLSPTLSRTAGEGANESLREFHYCVGLTGGIGSGKSTVAKLFEELGAAIIDTDAISHQLTQADGQAMATIRSAFGKEFITPTGALDRIRMRQLITTHADAKHKLEHILHPLILEICKKQMFDKTHSPYLILMAPLLLEAPTFLQLVHRVLLIDCTEQNQIARVMKRSGMSESEIRAIIALQLTRAERMKHANDIIQNDGACDDLKNQVAALHHRYLAFINNHLTAG